MAIVLELLDGDDHRLEMRQLPARPLTVGRAFDCDFILADTHVDPHHCRIESSEEGGFLVSDLGSVNGTRIARRPLRNAQRRIASGTVLTLGRSRLRVTDSALPLPAAQPLTGLDKFVDWAGHLSVCVLLLLLATAVSAVVSYLHSDAKFRFSDVFGDWLFSFSVLFGVAGVWALIGRIGRRRANLYAHLAIALIAGLLIVVWEFGAEAALYNLNRLGQAWYLLAIGTGIIFVAGQFVHLSLATQLRRGPRLALAALFFLVSPGIVLYQGLEGLREFNQGVDHYMTIYPPGWYVGRTLDAEQFGERSTEMFNAAQRDADRPVD